MSTTGRTPPVSTWLREFRPDDAGFLRELFVTYLREEARKGPLPASVAEYPDTYLPGLIEKAGGPEGRILVAETDGNRSGFVVALPKPPQPWDRTTGRVAMIMELHVAGNRRRLGVGRLLVRGVEEHFARLGFAWVSLGTMATNSEAHRFYEAMGYVVTYQFRGRPLVPAASPGGPPRPP